MGKTNGCQCQIFTKLMETLLTRGGGDPSGWTPAPLTVGPAGGGGGGGPVGAILQGAVGLGGGYLPPGPSVGSSQAPLTSPCPPSNHTISLNLTLTFATSWFRYFVAVKGQNIKKKMKIFHF